VAKNTNTPAAILETLANDSSKDLRVAVAKNPNTPVIVQESLSIDSKYEVRIQIAQNYKTPKLIAVIALLNLPQNQKQPMIAAAKQDPNYFNTYIIPKALSQCLKGSFSRLIIFLHPQTPSETLADHPNSLFWMERYAIAINPKTPPETLKTLYRDANVFVRAAAKSRVTSL